MADLKETEKCNEIDRVEQISLEADDTFSDEEFEDARENIDSPNQSKDSLKRFLPETKEHEDGPEYHTLEKEPISKRGTLRRSQVADGTVNKLLASFENQSNVKTSSLGSSRNILRQKTFRRQARTIERISTDLPMQSETMDVPTQSQVVSSQDVTPVGEDIQPVSNDTNSADPNVSNLYKIEKIYDSPPHTPFLSCKQGHGQPVLVTFPNSQPSQTIEDGQVPDDRLLKSDSTPTDLGQSDSVGTGKPKSRRRDVKKSATVGGSYLLRSSEYPTSGNGIFYDDENHYEELPVQSDEDTVYDEDGWGSSEFDDVSDEEEYRTEIHKPLPMKPKAKHDAGAPGLISRIKSFRGKKDEMEDDEDARCFPVNIDPGKHPPPELPPAPDGLTENQKKRRCVIEQIISSEKSYINSLERIIRGYESTVLDAIGNTKNSTRTVFKESREILSHHQMFQIEMADRVKKWDEDEKIGDVFTASFSKSMLVDAYSVYVNNFTASMGEIKNLQRSRQSFRDFLKLKETTSPDRLSIFGLMVKPVQRFPQFIMFLQDLVKYTPREHHDRRSLQLALTELENITHNLNERKRQSEQTFQAKQITSQLLRQITKQVPPRYLPDKTRRLIRQDDFEQVVGEGQQMKLKVRRLILMDDTVLCIKVEMRDVDGVRTEKIKLKWLINLSDVDLKDSAITPDMEVNVSSNPGRFSIWTKQLDRTEEDPFNLYSELSEILHDFTVLGQMSGLMSSLKRSYQGYGLTEDTLHEISKDLQKMIQIKDEQLKLVNSCSLLLSDKSSVSKTGYVFHTPTPNLKHEWCVDFLMAKLALEKCNNPSWDMAQNNEGKMPAYFMRALSVDVPRHFTKVKCAVPVFLPTSSSDDLGVQHLWVCSSNTDHGQVSVISIHNPKPCLIESFKATDLEIECMVLVPGTGSGETSTTTSFVEDTVWIATVKPEILIFMLTYDDGMKRAPVQKFAIPHQPSILVYEDEKVFCGLKTGSMLIYQSDDDGIWNFKSPTVMEFGSTPIRTVLNIDGYLWIACGGTIFILDTHTLKILMSHQLTVDKDAPIDQIARAGVGIWMSFKNRQYIKLYHIETLETLQEINVASPIARLIEKVKPNGLTKESTKHCVVSCLAAGKGMLWIGTSLGFILTLPLPRLREGVPLVNSRPSVSYHGHHHPVKFVIPIYCSSSVAQLEKKSSFRSSVKPRKLMRKPLTERESVSETETVSEQDCSQSTVSRSNSCVSSADSCTESKHRTMPAGEHRLSFRSELAGKISSKDVVSSNPDLFTSEGEVQMLYQTLLEPNATEKPVVVDGNIDKDSPPPANQVNNTDGQSDNVPSKPTEHRKKLSEEIMQEKCKTVHLSEKTLRKSTTNSVIVVSGGDGYSRWNSSKNTSLKQEEAVLLLWIYKF